MSGSQPKGAWSKPLFVAPTKAPPKASALAAASEVSLKLSEAKSGMSKEPTAHEVISAWRKPAGFSTAASVAAESAALTVPPLRRSGSSGKASGRFQIGESGYSSDPIPARDWVRPPLGASRG
jgi:hypothetical protein